MPIFVAIPVMGWVARNLGVEAFGIFTLALVVVGTSSILDMGVSKAVVREIAENITDKIYICKVMSVALTLLFIISLLVLLIGWVFSDQIIGFLNASEVDEYDLRRSLILVLASIPFTILSILLLAYLEGVQEFLLLNKLKILSGFFVAIFPLLGISFEENIVGAVGGVFLGRLIGFLFILFFVKKEVELYINLDNKVIKRLLSFGAWLTISNIISVLMQYGDRFIIARILGAANVSSYSAPSEIVSKLTLFPMAIVKVAFPKMVQDKNDNLFYKKTYFVLFCCGLSMLIGGWVLGEFFLKIWLGSAFEEISVDIIFLLLIGLFFNTLAQAPYMRLQAIGRADSTAYVHILEIVPYFIALYFLIQSQGVLGVAMAWVGRMVVDYIILTIVCKSIVRGN